jgi:Zn-dependent peptidase ImmA (M78 family)
VKKGVRTHKTIKEIKERYNYQLSNIQQDEIDEIIKEILMALKTTGVCPSIIDIINKLGFTVYNFPFEKDGVDDESKSIRGFLGVGFDFNINENSNCFLIDKYCENKKARFIAAYLLSHYILNINDEKTDKYHFCYHEQDLKNCLETRFALSFLMPKEAFSAQVELLKIAYETADKTLSKDELLEILANTFQVTTAMVKARMILLK